MTSPALSQTLNNYAQAVQTLGKQFITPEDIENHFGVPYSPEEKQHAEDTVPIDPDFLNGVRQHGCLLVYGPSRSSMNLREVCKFTGLSTKSLKGQYCSKQDVVAANKWHIVRVLGFERHDRAMSIPQDDKRHLVNFQPGHKNPNVAELAYAILLYRIIKRNLSVCSSHYLRTSSAYERGSDKRVSIGYFDESHRFEIRPGWGADYFSFRGEI